MPYVRGQSRAPPDVKLLLDQNLSHLLVGKLSDVFPGSGHVRDFGLQNADDLVVWNFARDQDYMIVSKDSDFRQLSFLRGCPPKVIWLNVGNCTTTHIETTLRTHVVRIIAFYRDPVASFLVLP